MEGALALLRTCRYELWVTDPSKGRGAFDAWEAQYKEKYELAKLVQETAEDRLGSSGIDEMLNRRKELENGMRPLKKELEELESIRDCSVFS